MTLQFKIATLQHSTAQHSTAQHSTAQHSTAQQLVSRSKFIKYALLASSLFVSNLAFSSDNYGCEAVLCFAGGKGVAECQPTIKRVLKDLSKGKPFPTCVGYNSNITANLGTEVYRNKKPKSEFFCPDNQTRPYLSFKNKDDDKYRHFCRKITINVPTEIASDNAHIQQVYYFE